MTSDDACLRALYSDLLDDDDPDRLTLISALDAVHAAPPPALDRATLDRIAATAALSRPAPSRLRLVARRWPLLAGVGVAAAIAVAIGLGIFNRGGATEVSAQSILQKAQTATTGAVGGGVSSYYLKVTGHNQDGSIELTTSSDVWSAGADRLRIDSQTSGADGQAVGSQSMIADGEQLWLVNTQNGATNVGKMTIAPGSFLNQFSPIGGSVDAVAAALNGPDGCGSAQRAADGTVAGRPVYVLNVTIGGPNCAGQVSVGPAGATPDAGGCMVSTTNGMYDKQAGPITPPVVHEALSIDKQTFIPLKEVTDSAAPDGSHISGSFEVTQVQYNIAIPDATFAYTPPANATVTDNGAMPAGAVVGQGVGGTLMIRVNAVSGSAMAAADATPPAGLGSLSGAKFDVHAVPARADTPPAGLGPLDVGQSTKHVAGPPPSNGANMACPTPAPSANH